MKNVSQRKIGAWVQKYSPEHKRILVVDDDLAFLARIQKFAKKNHLPITTCSSLRAAYEAARKNDFDVGLVDYYLGEHEGTDLADIVPKLPLIVMSSIPLKCIEGMENWPETVEKFVSKSTGFESIFEKVCRVIRSKNRDSWGGV